MFRRPGTMKELIQTAFHCLTKYTNFCKSTKFSESYIEISFISETLEELGCCSSFEDSPQLIHALITTTLDYCNDILFNLPKNIIKILQRIQNQAARMLKRIPRRDHITPVLKDLHWLRINERIEFKILILTHRAFYETGPMYLSELIKKHNSSNQTRRANDHCLLSIAPISKMCANIAILNNHLVMLHLFGGIN